MQPGPNDFNFDLPGLSELPPPDLSVDDYGQPTEQPADGEKAPFDPAKLAAQVEELEKKLASAEQRLSDTQRWGHQQNAGREIVEALAAAKAREAEEARARAEAEKAFTLPTLTEDELEELVAVPSKLNDHILNVAATMANRVYAPLASRLQAAEAFTHIAGPMIEFQADRVAESVLAQEKVAAEDAARLKQETRNGLWAAAKGDPVMFARYSLDPEMNKWALRFVLDNQPAGTRPSPRGPSIGSDPGAGRGGGRSGGDAPAPSLAAAQIGRALGITFTKDDLADVHRKVTNRRR